MGMLMTMIIFAALRYNVGWDYAAYWEGVNSPYAWSEEISRYSVLWRVLFATAYKFRFPPIAIVIPNIITYLCVYIGIRMLNLNKKRQVDALLVYILWPSLYLASFSTIRQGLAIGIGVVAFALLNQKKYIGFFITLALCVCSHPSSIILVFLLPVYLLRSKLNFKIILFAIGLIYIILTSTSYIIGQIGLYEVYLSWSDDYGGKDIYVKLIIIVYLLFAFRVNNNISEIDKQCYFLTIISFVGSVLIFFMGFSSVLSRIFSYFTVFFPIILIPSVSHFKLKRLYHQVSVILLVGYMFAYLWVVSGVESESGFVPYKCILFENVL